MKTIKLIIYKKENGINLTDYEKNYIKKFIENQISFKEHFGEENTTEEANSLIDKIKNLFPEEFDQAIETTINNL